MITLYHAPMSRSSTLMSLIDEMGIADRISIKQTNIVRFDGTGGLDPANPHPEGKAPVLVHEGQVITERAAIILYLTTLFPEAGLAPEVGTPEWGSFLTWLAWYQGVFEPVLIHEAAGLSHPYLSATFRGHAEAAARIRAALDKGPWLLGDRFSAADLLVHSPYAWFKDAVPKDDLIRDWVARCQSRPAVARTRAADAERMAA